MIMYELAGEAAALLMSAAGASPTLVAAVRRMTPKLIEFARKNIEAGKDPDAELDLMMAAAEEQARAAFLTKFGDRT